jgi:serine/threonine protein kinase
VFFVPGKFSTVFKPTSQPVALKGLGSVALKSFNQPEAVEAILCEANLLYSCNHVNIVKCFHILLSGQHVKHVSLVMELCDYSLEHLLSKPSHCGASTQNSAYPRFDSPDERVRMLKEINQGLRYLHEVCLPIILFISLAVYVHMRFIFCIHL